MVRTEFPAVHLIASSDNLGYSRGNNLGLAQARGRFAFILNPDTEVDSLALPSMVGYLDAHPDVGVLGPRLILARSIGPGLSPPFPNAHHGAF